MAGKGGGAWKVAYADFVTAMMAFFMVMWLTTQKEGVKEAVAGYFREPFATFKSSEKGAAATAKPVEKPMYGHKAQPQKRLLPKAGKDQDYQFTVLFAVGKAELDAEQQESIADFAPTMTGKLNRLEVRSHCLRRPLPKDSPFKDHWELCYSRCRAVQDELVKQGIEPERIRLSQAEGNEPLALNLGDDELKLNSRVDVILLPDLAELPWERQKTTEATANDDHDADGHGDGEHGKHARGVKVHGGAVPEEPKHGGKQGDAHGGEHGDAPGGEHGDAPGEALGDSHGAKHGEAHGDHGTDGGDAHGHDPHATDAHDAHADASPGHNEHAAGGHGAAEHTEAPHGAESHGDAAHAETEHAESHGH